MSRDFDGCLKKRRVVRQDSAAGFIPPELEAARSDLESARRSLDKHVEKWATIQAYYSIFHDGAASALQSAERFLARAAELLKAG
jgi:HEPN domain-containing protein